MPNSDVTRTAQRPLLWVPMRAMGGGADDWPSIIGQANALAYRGAVVLLPTNGDLLCKSVTQLASGATIIGRPGVRVVSSLTPTGGPGGYLQSVFYADKTNGAATTLAATPARGTNKISTVANYAPGTTIVITRTSLVAQSFVVLASGGGGGPFLLTLDDVLEFSFQAGDVVTAVTRPQDILIDGHGMQVTGTGDRCVELVCTERATVRGLRITRAAGSFTSIVCSFDVAGRDNGFQDVIVDGGGVSAAGIAMESGVLEQIISCRVAFTGTASTNIGILALSSARGVISRCHVEECGTGVFLAYSDALDVDACHGMQVSNVVSQSNAVHGFLQSGGFGNEYTNVEGASNGESGFAFDVSTFGQAPSATLVNVTANDNAGAHGGVYLAGAGASVDVKGLTAERNVGAGIDILGAAAVCLVEGFRPTDNQGGAWVVEAAAGSAQLKIANAYARKTVAAGILQGQLQSATCVVSVVDYTAEFVAGAGITALADIQAAGTFIFRGCRTKGVLGFGVVAAAGVASKVIQDGSANDFTSATTPYFFDASALVNFGTFLANGVTPVVVPGAFLADQTIAISFQTLGGVQGAQPTITAKAANSFSVTATAGDLSLYDWKAT